MKLLFVFALIHLAAALSSTTPEKCQELRDLIEFTLNKVYGFSDDTEVPVSTNELVEVCANAKTTSMFLEDYQKCLKEFPGKVFAASTRSLGKVMEKGCGGEEEKLKLLKLFQCLKPLEKSTKIDACSVGTWDVLDQLAESRGDQPVTAAFCCLSLLNEDCIAKRMNQTKCEDASVKLSEYIGLTSGPLHSDVLSGICQDYKTIAACEAKIPKQFAKYKVMVFNETVRETGRSLLNSLIRVSEKVSPQTGN